jgi:hypothetical protein
VVRRIDEGGCAVSETQIWIFVAVYFVVVFAVMGLMIASFWKIFEKAGQPGWAAIVPIYNTIVILELVGRPVWWLLLFFIPFAGIVFAFIVMIDLARSYGQGTGFGVGLVLLPIVFAPILGFGSSRYVGPAAGGAGSITPRIAA